MKVAVLGGGISGLSTAYYLSKSKHVSKVILIERSGKLGGWMQSERLEDGTIIEKGPRSIRANGYPAENMLCLLQDLNLESDILPISRSHPAAKERYIFAKSKLNKVPSSLASMLFHSSPFTRSLAALSWKEPFHPKSREKDESIYNFIARRLDKEIAQYLIDPMCRGIYAGNAQKLSVRSCFPSLFNMEKNYGSIIKAAFFKISERRLENRTKDKAYYQKWSIFTMRNGLQDIVDRLEQRLQQSAIAQICLNCPVTAINFLNGEVMLKYGKKEEKVDHVFSCFSGRDLYPCLSKELLTSAANLNCIESVDVAVVTLQYDFLTLPYQGFGHLVPSWEPSKILGVVYESCIFPEHDGADRKPRLTVMMGGAWFQELFGENVTLDKVTEVAVAAVRDQLNVTHQPSRTFASIHKNCIPQYHLGHYQKIDDLSKSFKELPITLLGADFEGVSVNDCVLNSKISVDKYLSQFDNH